MNELRPYLDALHSRLHSIEIVFSLHCECSKEMRDHIEAALMLVDKVLKCLDAKNDADRLPVGSSRRDGTGEKGGSPGAAASS